MKFLSENLVCIDCDSTLKEDINFRSQSSTVLFAGFFNHSKQYTCILIIYIKDKIIFEAVFDDSFLLSTKQERKFITQSIKFCLRSKKKHIKLLK